jgi:hypothetical protein
MCAPRALGFVPSAVFRLYRGDNRIQDYSTKNRRVSGLGSGFGEPHHQKDAEQLMSSVRISEILEQVAPADKRGEKSRDGSSGVSCAGSIGIWFENYANVYIRHDIRCEEGLIPEKRVRANFKREVCPKFEH